MNRQENIKKMYKQAKLDTLSEKDKAVLEKMKEIYLQESKSKSKPAEFSIWRIIMKSKISKLATAAVIIIGILFILNNSGSSIDGSSLALGQTIEKMKEMPWILATAREAHGSIDQYWFGFDAGVRAIGNKESLRYSNEKEGVEYLYSPQLFQQRVIYSYKIQKGIYDYPSMKEPTVPETVFKMTKEVMENIEKQTTHVKRKVVNQEGEKVEVITATIPSIPNTSEGYKVEIRRSVERDLLLSQDIIYKNKDSNIYWTFSYPTEGPNSIYDMGAPKDAEVRDVTIPAEIVEIIKKINTLRATNLTNYVALSLPAEIEQLPSSFTDSRPEEYFTIEDNLASLIWRKDSNGCHSMGYFPSKKDAQSNVNVTTNIQSASELFLAVSSDIYEMEEQNYYSYEMVDQKPVYKVSRGNTDWYGRTVFIEMINWPYIAGPRSMIFDWKIDSVVGADNRTLIKIERGSFRTDRNSYSWFIDPARDYICCRFEYGLSNEEPIEKIEILEYAQTQSGQWYPRLIQKTYKETVNRVEQQKKCARLIYLQENPELPKGIFDPNSFPK